MGLHAKYPYPCQILLKLSRQIFKKYSNFKKIRPVGRKNITGDCGVCDMVHSVSFHHPNRSIKPTDFSSFYLVCWNGTINRDVTLRIIVFRYANIRHPCRRILSHENRRSWITVIAVCYRHTVLDSYTVAPRFETRQGHGYRLSLYFPRGVVLLTVSKT